MSIDTAQLLDRFHRVLVDEIKGSRPDLLESPFTVAEIYQDLVPYGSHRNRIGVEMNADYEHLLLMLLAGEGGYLILDSEAARDELEAELQTPNPNPSRFREYAAADVRLNPDRLSEPPSEDHGGNEDGTEAPEPTGTVEVDALAPTDNADPEGRDGAEGGEGAEGEGGQTGGEGYQDDDGEPGDEVSDAVVGLAEKEDAEEWPTSVQTSDDEVAQEDRRLDERPAVFVKDPSACRSCRERLPDRSDLRFCPFCGADTESVPDCEACGGALEPDWRFCVACGAEVAPV